MPAWPHTLSVCPLRAGQARFQSFNDPMDGHDKHHLPPPQSSLPSSLIPHLYSGPQQPRYSQTRTTLRTEDLPPHDWPDRPTSTHHNPGPRLSLSQHRRLFPSLESTSSEIRDKYSEKRLSEHLSTPLHRASDPPFSFPQRHSSPAFYTSSRPAMSHRNFGHTLPPLIAQKDVPRLQMQWREGEAGPSSLLRPASQDDTLYRHRRGLSQPIRVDQRSFDGSMTGSEQGTEFDQSRHMFNRDSYRSTSGSCLPSNIYIYSL